MKILRSLSRIFNYLNVLDLPEYFEDNLPFYMKEFLQYLAVNSPVLSTSDPDEPGPLELLQCSIVENIVLYADRYDEEFQVCELL